MTPNRVDRGYPSVRTGLFEHLRNFREMRSVRLLQRCAARFIRGIGISTVSKQHSSDLGLPLYRCDHQRRATEVVAILGGDMLIQENPHLS